MDQFFSKSFLSALSVIIITLLCPFMASGKSLDNLSVNQILSGQSRVYIRNQEAVFKKSVENDVVARGSGGDVGGGGTTIFWQGQRKLIDIFNLKSDSTKKSINQSEVPYGRLTKVDFKKTRLDSAIQGYIQRLIPYAPKLAEALKQVYNVVPFYFARGQFTFVSNSFELDANVHYPEGALFSTVAFNIQNFGILISGDQFFEMDFDNQVALVVHEMVRSLQIQFALNTSHREIQDVTAAIIVGSERKSILLNSSLVQFLEALSFSPLIDRFKSLVKNNVRSTLLSSTDIDISSFDRLDYRKPKTWFDLSNVVNEASAEQLRFILKNQPNLSEESRQDLMEEMQKLDKLSADMKAQGFNIISSQALRSQVQIQHFVYFKDQGNFISTCSEDNSNQRECEDLYRILSELIH